MEKCQDYDLVNLLLSTCYFKYIKISQAQNLWVANLDWFYPLSVAWLSPFPGLRWGRKYRRLNKGGRGGGGVSTMILQSFACDLECQRVPDELRLMVATPSLPVCHPVKVVSGHSVISHQSAQLTLNIALWLINDQ